MSLIRRLTLAATLTAALLAIPATSSAADPCPKPYMTVAEFDQIVARFDESLSPAEVTRIVGSFGRYTRTDKSEAGRPVLLFVWRYCRAGEGWNGADQWLGWERVAGSWTLTEIR